MNALFERDNLWIGLIIGLVVPFVGFAVLLAVVEQLEALGIMEDEGFSGSFRQRTNSVVAICLNIITVNLFQRNKATNSVRGIVLATITLVAIWVFYFFNILF